MMKKTMMCLLLVCAALLLGTALAEDGYDPSRFYPMDFSVAVHPNHLGATPNGTEYSDIAKSATAYFYRTETLTDNKGYCPAFILYADFTTQEEAYEALERTGLRQLADEQQAVAIVTKRVGDTYGEADVQLYRDFETYLLCSADDTIHFNYTWNQRNFIFAEGEAASFVHDYLSGKNGHIAAVCLVGGDVTNTDYTYGMPAYLANASEDVMDYYQRINSADVQDGNHLYCAEKPVMQIVLGNETELNEEAVRQFWNTIGHKTVRNCLAVKVYLHYMEESFHWFMMPIAEEKDFTIIEHNGDVLPGAAAVNEWYIYMPNRLTGTDSKVPLLVVLHGSGDHPKFEAESQGWVDLLTDNDMIILSIRHQNIGKDDKGSDINLLVDAVIAEYPMIDTSRVYIAGFSAGASTVARVLEKDLTKYAAAVSLHAPGVTLDLEALKGQYIPVAVSGGMTDDTVKVDGILKAINAYAQLNECAYELVDPSLENLFGLGMEGAVEIKSGDLTYYTKYLLNDAGVPMVQVTDVANLSHAHTETNAPVMWRYISQFSRAEDGSVVYTPAE